MFESLLGLSHQIPRLHLKMQHPKVSPERVSNVLQVEVATVTNLGSKGSARNNLPLQSTRSRKPVVPYTILIPNFTDAVSLFWDIFPSFSIQCASCRNFSLTHASLNFLDISQASQFMDFSVFAGACLLDLKWIFESVFALVPPIPCSS